MDELKQYFNEKLINSECSIEFCTENLNKSENIPTFLNDLYRLVAHATFSFGQIFTIEKALLESDRLPFKPNWFVFGRDKYFSFWVCLYKPNADGLSFTSWDHESGFEIGDATDRDLICFLKDVEADYSDSF